MPRSRPAKARRSWTRPERTLYPPSHGPMDALVSSFLAAHPSFRLRALGARANRDALDLAPFGHAVEYLDAAEHPAWVSRYHAANKARFPGFLALPGWVLVDLYLMPAAIGLLTCPAPPLRRPPPRPRRRRRGRRRRLLRRPQRAPRGRHRRLPHLPARGHRRRRPDQGGHPPHATRAHRAGRHRPVGQPQRSGSTPASARAAPGRPRPRRARQGGRQLRLLRRSPRPLRDRRRHDPPLRRARSRSSPRRPLDARRRPRHPRRSAPARCVRRAHRHPPSRPLHRRPPRAGRSMRKSRTDGDHGDRRAAPSRLRASSSSPPRPTASAPAWSTRRGASSTASSPPTTAGSSTTISSTLGRAQAEHRALARAARAPRGAGPRVHRPARARLRADVGERPAPLPPAGPRRQPGGAPLRAARRWRRSGTPRWSPARSSRGWRRPTASPPRWRTRSITSSRWPT